MTRGLDANTVLTNQSGCLAKQSIQFAGRYYKHSDSCLQRAEAEALSRAGIWIVSIWETNPTYPRYFTRGQGQLDGTHSLGMAIDAGQPQGTAIYYTVDYDASPSDLPQIEEYFRGIADQNSPYCVGVYGSGLVCQHVRAAGLAEVSWLAAPLEWQGSEYADWNIRQTAVNRTLCSVSVDLDVSKGNGRGWTIDAP